MGCDYSINGRILIKPEQADEAKQAFEALEKNFFYMGEFVWDDAGPPVVYVNVGDSMGWQTAEELDIALEEFGRKYAAEGAVLNTQCEGESAFLSVGPDELACIDAEIAYWENDKRVAERRIEDLRLSRTKLVGESPYGN